MTELELVEELQASTRAPDREVLTVPSDNAAFMLRDEEGNQFLVSVTQVEAGEG